MDGGQSFSPAVYLNQSQTAKDGVSKKTVDLGPIPDNQSAKVPASRGDGSILRDSDLAFGDHLALAAFAGKVYALWPSNQNGGTDVRHARDRLGLPLTGSVAFDKISR